MPHVWIQVSDLAGAQSREWSILRRQSSDVGVIGYWNRKETGTPTSGAALEFGPAALLRSCQKLRKERRNDPTIESSNGRAFD